MIRPTCFRQLPMVVALQAVFALTSAQAADFTVGPGATVTAGQALNTAGNIGTVGVGGNLSVGAAVQAVTLTGSGAITLNNNGVIEQTGTARAIRNNAGAMTFRLNNAGTISSLADDVVKMGVAGSVFVLTNTGTIWQRGAGTASGQALDLRDLTSTGNVINNGSASNTTATIRADGDDALRSGANTTITNYGTIISNGVVNTSCRVTVPAVCPSGAPSAHDGIDAGARTGVVVNNYGLISGPRHGITADTAINVSNFATGQIIGRNGSGVGSDGTGTVVNYGLISGRYVGSGLAYDHLGNRNTFTDPTQTTASNGDGDGVDIDGVGTVTNFGRIEGLGGGGFDSGGRPNGGDGLALGGGTVTNMAGAVIWGKSNGILVDDGANGTDAVNPASNRNRGTATAAAGALSITNSGEITGDRKAAIGLVGNWNDTLVNNATGVITGGADTQQVDMLSTNPAQRPGAAIQMGAGDDTLTNYGRIQGKNGLAIDMGSGNDTVRLFNGGGTGVVIGTVDGSAGVDTLETGGVQNFAAGTITNFENFVVRNGSTAFNYGLGLVNSVQVDASAALQVNGALSTTGNLTINGTFKAPVGSELRTINVGGDLVMGASSALEARVGNGNADQIRTAGSAVISNGATIVPITQGYVANGAAVTLISATSGLTANAASLNVANNSALVSYSLSTTASTLVLNARRMATFSSLAPAGQGGFGAALEALGQRGNGDGGGSGNGSVNPLFTALDLLATTQGVTDALKQIAPEANRASAQAAQAATDSVFSAFDDRFDFARGGGLAQAGVTGLAAGDTGGKRTWAQVLGAFGEQGERANASGYKMHTYGLAAGVETNRSANEVMGVSLAYTQAGTDGKGAGLGDDNRMRGINLGGYFSQDRQGVTLDGAVVLGVNRYQAQRTVVFPGFLQIASGNYGGWQLSGQLEAGFPFGVRTDLSGRWLVGARVGYVETDAYTESGNIAVAQQINAARATSLQSVLGMELKQLLADKGTLLMRARYLREFSGSPDISGNFVAGGSGFTVNGAAPNRNALQLGIGYSKVASSGATVSIRYDAQAKDKYLAHQLAARASWAF